MKILSFRSNEKQNHLLVYNNLLFHTGDIIGAEVCSFHPQSSVVLFHRNLSGVGTRFLTQPNHEQFLPTVAICGNGSDVRVNITWQFNVDGPPLYSVVSINTVIYQYNSGLHTHCRVVRRGFSQWECLYPDPH